MEGEFAEELLTTKTLFQIQIFIKSILKWLLFKFQIEMSSYDNMIFPQHCQSANYPT